MLMRMNEEGTTLAEVLAAITLLALVSVIMASGFRTSLQLLERGQMIKKEREDAFSRLERNSMPDETGTRKLSLDFDGSHMAEFTVEEKAYGYGEKAAFLTISAQEQSRNVLSVDELLADTMYQNCQLMLEGIRAAGFRLDVYKNQVLSDDALYQGVMDKEGFSGSGDLHCDTRSIRQLFYCQYYGTGWPAVSQAVSGQFQIGEDLIIWPDFQMGLDDIHVEIYAIKSDSSWQAPDRKYLVFDTENKTWELEE